MVALPDMIVRHVVRAVVSHHVALPHHPQHGRLVGGAVSLLVVDGQEVPLAAAEPQTVDEECPGTTERGKLESGQSLEMIRGVSRKGIEASSN